MISAKLRDDLFNQEAGKPFAHTFLEMGGILAGQGMGTTDQPQSWGRWSWHRWSLGRLSSPSNPLETMI
jgi:hypothetical protein